MESIFEKVCNGTMDTPPRPEVTALLKAWGSGDLQALDRLMPQVYAELRRMSNRYMKEERPGHTLQVTALVHDVYLKLVDLDSVDWKDRAHFYGVCAQMMRRILVDSARARRSGKRGGPTPLISLDNAPDVGASKDRELVALDDAMNTLAQMDPRKVSVIELRYFGGLSVEETAEVLKISAQSVMRDWKLSKAWLQREMCRGIDAGLAGS
jgi:RNA polymerase sigma-70 factor, ECF subfamily